MSVGPEFGLGDNVRVKPHVEGFSNTLGKVTSVVEPIFLDGSYKYYVKLTSGSGIYLSEQDLTFDVTQEFVRMPPTTEYVATTQVQSDGGPSNYYDFPSEWQTFNDFIEYKSVNQWKGFSFHLGNIGKAICRWGDKGGTTIEYDAKKIIYSATRVLKMIVGVDKTREYLKVLLDDEQFKG